MGLKSESRVKGIGGLDMCEGGRHAKVAITKMRVRGRRSGSEEIAFLCAYCAADVRDGDDYEVVAETADFDESI